MSSNEQDESVQWTSGDAQNATGTTAPQQSENANQANVNPNASQGNNHNNTFLHPGARAIFEGTVSGDGPYECRKCGDAVLTVSVTPCPACLDPHPWFPRD
ncbi:hypothetical protein EDB84DRAFT_1444194 [Lactarius hengduanensis]|nr:hypothetical protein EDB84DRAFT_1444194 [Lactarius hengduanensis]